MRVVYDHQIFSLQRTGGISRYFVNLLHHLREYQEIETSLLLKYSNNLYLQDKNNSPYLPPKVLQKQFKGNKFLLGKINEQMVKKVLKKGEYDIFHPTYYNTYFSKTNTKPYVLTVHDMTHERFPQQFKSNHDFTLQYKEEAIINASHIIAISEHTKKDLLEFYSIPESKITVIYHGIEKEYVGQKIDGLPLSYFLYVGERGGYKNFEVVAEALAKTKDKTVHLICTGKPWDSKEIGLLKNLGIENLVHHITVNDNQLNYLYENALSLVYPSYYEGFGYPILEAMRASCPVILSRASCFPEIGNNAARYFDPQDANELAKLMRQTIESNFNRNFWIQMGIQNFSHFSIKQSVEKTIEVYKNINL